MVTHTRSSMKIEMPRLCRPVHTLTRHTKPSSDRRPTAAPYIQAARLGGQNAQAAAVARWARARKNVRTSRAHTIPSPSSPNASNTTLGIFGVHDFVPTVTPQSLLHQRGLAGWPWRQRTHESRRESIREGIEELGVVLLFDDRARLLSDSLDLLGSRPLCSRIDAQRRHLTGTEAKLSDSGMDACVAAP